MSVPRTALHQQIKDGIYWGIIGALNGAPVGLLVGGTGGLIVGGSVGLLKVGWSAFDATILRGNRLTFIEAYEMSCEIFDFAYEGSKIGGLILASVCGVSYGIFLGCVMIERPTERSVFTR